MEIPRPIVKNQAIIDAIPKGTKCVLEVGAGDGRLSDYLRQFYEVTATDIDPEIEQVIWGDILKLETFPVQKADVVIASQVLEHLRNWQLALENTVQIARNKVIITVPKENRIKDPGHIVTFYDETIKDLPYKLTFNTLAKTMYLIEIYGKK